jgi:small subunit ribosomal protein S1
LISVGDIVVGTVAACESFGAFIVHDDVQYFVPLHELAWRKISHSSDVVAVGQPCEIIVDRTDNAPPGGPLASVRRVSPEQNPWFDPSLFSVGTQFSWPIAVQHDYGLFVAHPRGVEGLLHSDDIPHGFAAAIGDVIAVEITECNIEAEQIRLSLVGKL